MATKRKNVVVTMEKRLEALGRIDKGESIKSIASYYGVGTSTVSDWKKNRKNIEDFCYKMISKDSLDNRCKAKKAKNETLDEALFVWFCAERGRGLPLSGPIIQQKALSLNKNLPDSDSNFTASQGWLDRWKKRHGIHQLTVTGESLSGNSEAADKFKNEFENFVKKENLSAEQIYNADETGLFYRMLPSKTLAMKIDDSAKGFKKSKDRLTIMACSNASGNHKFPLLLIGKSKNPRALKNVNRESLPVMYRSQKSAWMDSAIFKDWFFNCFVPGVTKYLKDRGLPVKAVLLIDNAPTHPAAESLVKGDITVKYLPPNVTSLIQPMDQGVLETIKRVYRRHMLGQIIEGDGQGVVDILKSFNVKTVLYMVSESWEQVGRSTLIKSWKKLWPNVCDLPENQIKPVEKETENEVQPQELLGMIKDVNGCSEVDINDIESWLEADNDGGYGNLTDDQIIATCCDHNSDNKDDTDEENPDNLEIISHAQAANNLDELMLYFEQQEETTPAELLMLKRMRDRTARKRHSKLTQLKLTKFFEKN